MCQYMGLSQNSLDKISMVFADYVGKKSQIILKFRLHKLVNNSNITCVKENMLIIVIPKLI